MFGWTVRYQFADVLQTWFLHGDRTRPSVCALNVVCVSSSVLLVCISSVLVQTYLSYILEAILQAQEHLSCML